MNVNTSTAVSTNTPVPALVQILVWLNANYVIIKHFPLPEIHEGLGQSINRSIIAMAEESIMSMWRP